MSFILKKRGDFSHINKHNLLDNIHLHDQHPIESIIDLSQTLDNIHDNINILSNKIYNGDIGLSSGMVYRPKYHKKSYYSDDLLIKEEFIGEISKIVTYEYNDEKQLVKKTVQRHDGTIYFALYKYDENGNVIEIQDNGTEEDYIYAVSGTASSVVIEKSYSTELEQEVCNFQTLFKKYNMATIVNSEILISNQSKDNATLTVKRGSDIVFSVSVPPHSSQKYIAGINNGIQIYVTGSINVYVTISYIQNDKLSKNRLSPTVVKFLHNLSMYVSDMQFRYDNILQSVNNNSESFTDLMENYDNFYEVINYN